MSPLVEYAGWNRKNKKRSRIACWAWVLASVLLVHWISQQQPAGTRMLLIIVALLLSMKSVVTHEYFRDHPSRTLNWMQWIVFLVGWPGMRPGIFSKFPGNVRSDFLLPIQKGTLRLIVGMVVFGLAVLVWNLQAPAFRPEKVVLLQLNPISMKPTSLLATLLAMVAFSLIVHFGVFNWLTGFWRMLGVKTNTLFVAPLLSRSLAEFWGKRWNLAFSEMTTIAVFRPVKKRFGQNVATFLGFVFSGALHELAISFPVNAGYGLPMAYFAIHGFAIYFENRLLINCDWFRTNRLLGIFWTVTWIMLPLPLLFHGPFLQGCIWPLLQWQLV